MNLNRRVKKHGTRGGKKKKEGNLYSLLNISSGGATGP